MLAIFRRVCYTVIVVERYPAPSGGCVPCQVHIEYSGENVHCFAMRQHKHAPREEGALLAKRKRKAR